jgi:hypothetical protein
MTSVAARTPAAAATPPGKLTALAAALANPRHRLFTREQVLELLAAQQRWAREVADDRADLWGPDEGYEPPLPVMVAGRWTDQVDARREWDASARNPRSGDFPGGLPAPSDPYPSEGRRPPFPRRPQPWLGDADRRWIRRWLADHE